MPEKKSEPEEMEVAEGQTERVHLHDGESRHQLRPGDWHAPASNPGAAAQVPTQPLQPESLQSHGQGIVHDKDLMNPPYDEGNPRVTDRSPSGSGSPSNLTGLRTVEDRIRADKLREAKDAVRRAQIEQDRADEMAAQVKAAHAKEDPNAEEAEDIEEEDIEEDVEEEDPETKQKRVVKRKVKRAKHPARKR